MVDQWFWTFCLGLTLLIEVAVFGVCRRWGRASFSSIPVGPAVLGLIGLNLVSHPLAWQAVTNGAPWLMSELIVIAVETVGLVLIVPGLGRWNAARLSLWCNAVSGTVGLPFVFLKDSLLSHNSRTGYAFSVVFSSLLS
ncbi:MAG: hypothetical protein JNL67_08765 [Planctomycetaceae bacterium]|nr:hypothetical protein [Planctomycetaceae bacterium]